jgi:hypothetical protein
LKKNENDLIEAQTSPTSIYLQMTLKSEHITQIIACCPSRVGWGRPGNLYRILNLHLILSLKLNLNLNLNLGLGLGLQVY